MIKIQFILRGKVFGDIQRTLSIISYEIFCSYVTTFCTDEGLQMNTYALTMQLISIALERIPSEIKNKFEIVCCACLFIACKLEEVYVKI